MDEGTITVTSQSAAGRWKRRVDAVITVEDPVLRNGLRFHSAPHPDHLVLRFEDVDDPVGHVALPCHDHVRAALAFARMHERGRLLVHCRAGIARSTALALAVMADRGRDPREAVRRLLEIRPAAVPNLLVLKMADDVLSMDGALEEAWMEVERSDPEYAAVRKLKRDALAMNPGMYSKPLADVGYSAWRYLPDSLVRTPGLALVEEIPVPVP